jgi:hypothetical protein
MCSAQAHVRQVPKADMDRPPIARRYHRNVTPFTCGTRPTVYVSLLIRIAGITMNQNVPFIWRVNYRNEAAKPETFLEIAHEKALQYLRKNLSMHVGP